MKTIDFHKRKYREVQGAFQNIAMGVLKVIFMDLNFSCMEDALWDANPIIWYAHGMSVVRFEPKSFARLCETYEDYKKQREDK